MSKNKEKNKALWGGRFKKELHDEAKAFSYSIEIDGCLAPYDIQVNLAHSKALHQKGLLTDEEMTQLNTFFTDLQTKFVDDPESFFSDDEDIHSCIERLTVEALGDLGKKIHTGKSRNDQVITDMRLYLMDELEIVISKLEELMKTIWETASENKSLIIPGYTHLQPAQPVLLAHHYLAFFEKFSRDRGRFIKNITATDVCPLGSGALAGNNYGLDRELVAAELGFNAISRNSMDAVSDRDFMIEFCQGAALCMAHLSQFCEEIILWSSPTFGFIEIGDDFATGSSIMPQKKNPDIAELIRGKSARAQANATGMVQLIKGLPLTYNRDLQEDKEYVFDTAHTLVSSLSCFAKMLDSITFKPKNIEKALKDGFLLATDFADYLVKKGVAFRDSHEITGQVVLYCQENNKQLEELTFDELNSYSDKVEEDVLEIFDYSTSINTKTSFGNTAQACVDQELNTIQEVFKWQNEH